MGPKGAQPCSSSLRVAEEGKEKGPEAQCVAPLWYLDSSDGICLVFILFIVYLGLGKPEAGSMFNNLLEFLILSLGCLP